MLVYTFLELSAVCLSSSISLTHFVLLLLVTYVTRHQQKACSPKRGWGIEKMRGDQASERGRQMGCGRWACPRVIFVLAATDRMWISRKEIGVGDPVMKKSLILDAVELQIYSTKTWCIFFSFGYFNYFSFETFKKVFCLRYNFLIFLNNMMHIMGDKYYSFKFSFWCKFYSK